MGGVLGEGEEVEEVGYCCGGCVVAAEDEEFHLGKGGGAEGLGCGGGGGGEVFGMGEVDDGFAFLGGWGRCGGGVGFVGGRRGGRVAFLEDFCHVFVHDTGVVPVYEWFERVHVVERVGFGAEGTPADLRAEGGGHGVR